MSARADTMSGTRDGTDTPWRRYVCAFTGLVALLVAAVAAFNYVVDPLGIWRAVEIEGVNAAKSERRDYVYIFKAMDMQRLKPRVILLGSSRAAYGLNPAHPLFGQDEAYNLSIPGGHLPVIVAYLEHALLNNDAIETLILGIDMFSFNEYLPVPGDFEARRLGRKTIWPPDIAAALITRDALDSSVRTLMSNLDDPGYEPYTGTGQLTAIELQRTAERSGMPVRFDKSINIYLNGRTRYGRFALSEQRFDDIRRIVSLCAERGIRIFAYVPPVHAVLREAIAMRGHEESYRTWLTRLTEITPYWDFSGYNEITTEPIRFTMNNYWDVSHYRSGIGDLIISTMLEPEAAQPGFGRYVTAETVQAHIAGIDSEQERYRASHPDTRIWLAARYSEEALDVWNN